MSALSVASRSPDRSNSPDHVRDVFVHDPANATRSIIKIDEDDPLEPASTASTSPPTRHRARDHTNGHGDFPSAAVPGYSSLPPADGGTPTHAAAEVESTESGGGGGGDSSQADAPSPFDPKHPRRCPKCMRQYKSIAGMRTHYLTHFPPTHRCRHEGCTGMFVTKYRRDRHEKTHSLERPYACPVAACGATFKRQDSMRGHVRSVHMCLDRPVRKRPHGASDNPGGHVPEFRPADFPELVAFMKKPATPTAPEALAYAKSILQARKDSSRSITLQKIHSFAKRINARLRKSGVYYPPLEKASDGNMKQSVDVDRSLRRGSDELSSDGSLTYIAAEKRLARKATDKFLRLAKKSDGSAISNKHSPRGATNTSSLGESTPSANPSPSPQTASAPSESMPTSSGGGMTTMVFTGEVRDGGEREVEESQPREESSHDDTASPLCRRCGKSVSRGRTTHGASHAHAAGASSTSSSAAAAAGHFKKMSTVEVIEWLRVNELAYWIPRFKQCADDGFAIDGATLATLDEEILSSDFAGSKRIARRKLLTKISELLQPEAEAAAVSQAAKSRRMSKSPSRSSDVGGNFHERHGSSTASDSSFPSPHANTSATASPRMSASDNARRTSVSSAASASGGGEKRRRGSTTERGSVNSSASGAGPAPRFHSVVSPPPMSSSTQNFDGTSGLYGMSSSSSRETHAVNVSHGAFPTPRGAHRRDTTPTSSPPLLHSGAPRPHPMAISPNIQAYYNSPPNSPHSFQLSQSSSSSSSRLPSGNMRQRRSRDQSSRSNTPSSHHHQHSASFGGPRQHSTSSTALFPSGPRAQTQQQQYQNSRAYAQNGRSSKKPKLEEPESPESSSSLVVSIPTHFRDRSGTSLSD